jgi:acyl carrier protein
MLTFFCSCKKTEDVIIPDNSVPYYQSVTNLQIQSYVIKAFIDISGREPTSAERDSKVQQLKDNGLDSSARVAFIAELQNSFDYRKQFDNIYIAPMFDNIFDSLANVEVINSLNYFRTLAVSNGDSILSSYWAYEVLKMTQVREASNSYHSGIISLNEYKRRMANNYLYDQINMGVTNFVIACFENYLKRLPTDLELSNSETMSNGQSARIFMRDGSSKNDFLNIITTISGFYEGLVVDSYRHLLNRSPNSVEMNAYTVNLSNGSKNIKDLQRMICSSEEYAGF